jgi:hypothetical protein
MCLAKRGAGNMNVIIQGYIMDDTIRFTDVHAK